jgi:hypothetical protein
MARFALLCSVVVFVLLAIAHGQDASPSRFVGTWVGVQKWDIENPPPNAKTAQPVELDITVVDGKLVGVMTPFFGGSDGARFNEGRIVGDDLQASGGMGKPNAWKTTVKINFDFKVTADKNQLTGTADVLMGDVKWTRFKYELSKKRTRY